MIVNTVLILIVLVGLIGVVGGAYYLLTNRTIHDGEGGVIRVEKKLNQEEITDGDMTIITGEDIKLPSDFPKEVPVYPKGKIVTASYEPDTAHIQQQVSDSPEKVLAWYKEELLKNGWKMIFASPDGITVEKGNLVGGVGIIPANIADADGKIAVTFNYSTQEYMDEAFEGGPSYDDALQSLRDLEEKVGNDDIEWADK